MHIKILIREVYYLNASNLRKCHFGCYWVYDCKEVTILSLKRIELTIDDVPNLSIDRNRSITRLIQNYFECFP